MKTLKFAPHLVPLVLSGEKTSTWRLFDDKDLRVGDELSFVNKENDEEFAKVLITTVCEKRLDDVTAEDEVREGHEQYVSAEERLQTFRGYYGDRVTPDTMVKMLQFKIL